MTSYTNNDIDTAEATEMLKEMLNVGKVSESKESSSKRSMNGVEDIVVARRKDSDPFVTRQQIVLQGTDGAFSYAVEGEQVTFICRPSDHTTGSSKVKIKNIVNFGWESKYYHGRLVAVHLFGVYFAYALKTSAKEAAVRVINRNFDSRTLLKGMKGSIQDLSFAHGTSEVILAAVDEEGNLFVYDIKDEAEKVVCSPLLIIWSTESEKLAKIHLLKWCPYIPENPPDEYDDNLPKLLLATHDNMACLWSVGFINKCQGPGPFNSSDVNYEGRTRIQDHDEAIIEALISPDGSAVATASLSGEVKFFQLNTADSDSNLKCIHNWKPHSGKPLSCLLFLDDFKKPNFEAQFWKYSITGTNNNCELKVWSCETWNCLQTLRFEAPDGDALEPCLKPYLDLSATYLLLSDINRRNLYVLQIQQDANQNVVSVYCISEFPFNYPIVSFAILDAGRKKYKLILDSENVFEQSEYDRSELQLSDGGAGEDSYIEGIVVKLLLIQPKSLQECSIVFQPAVFSTESAWSICTMSQDSLMAADRLSDVSMDIGTPMETGSSRYSEEHTLTPVAAHSFGANKPQLLLTPDSFTTHSLPGTAGKQESSSIRLNVSLDSALGALSAINHTGASSIAKSENLLVDISEDSAPSNVSQASGLSRKSPINQSQDTSVATDNSSEEISARFKKTSNSTGSSPSLEVQEILAPQSDDGKVEEVFFGESASQKNGDVSVNKGQLGVTDMIRLASPEKAAVVNQNVRRSSLPSSTARVAQSPHVSLQESSPLTLAANQMANANNETALCKQVLHVASKVDHLEHDFKAFVANVQQQNQELMEMMKALTTCMTEKNTKMETILRSQEGRVLSALSQTVNNSIITRMESVVAAEFKNTVVPSVINMVDPLHNAIQTAVSQKLTMTDMQMKDAITKLIKSKPTMDAIGNATALQLHHTVGTAFKDICQAVVIPGFEKASQTMLKQICDTFQNGLKEYCHHMDTALTKRLTTVDQKIDNAESKLCQAAANVQLAATHLKSEMNIQIDEKLKLEFSKLEESLITKMQKVVRDTVSAAIKEQVSNAEQRAIESIRSRSVTPVIDSQVHQKQIAHLLRSGNYNAAFEQALSISDLKMVVYTCKQIEPAKVFSSTPCALQQPVLLSLIQQLAVDLLTETDLKLKYIEESVTQLDNLHPGTSSHIPGILKTLHSQLQAFIKDNPTSEHRTKVRMLILAATAQIAEL